jgi:hypothetical protein
MRTPTATPRRAPRDSCRTRPRRSLATTRPRGLAATTRRIAVDLTPQAVEQVAQRVAHLLQHKQPQAHPELITAGELARRLRVERPWIYKHRHLLGGQRIGDGPKAPWRFDLNTATQALAHHNAATDTKAGA